jgi:undecaprenol kinase
MDEQAVNRVFPKGSAPFVPELPETDVLLPPPALPFRRRSWRRSFLDACQGLVDAWQTQRNLRFHVYAGCAVIAAGAWCGLALIEWLWVSFAIGLVIFAELMNTAIEQTVDLVIGPRIDPLARRVKDIAAGCVMVAALIAVVIGCLTFGPHVLPR